MAFSDFYSFNLRYSLPYFYSLSFYDKKKFSSKKEQKTIDASEKVSFLTEYKTLEELVFYIASWSLFDTLLEGAMIIFIECISIIDEFGETTSHLSCFIH